MTKVESVPEGPWAAREAFSLLAPVGESSVDGEGWARAARTHFGVDLAWEGWAGAPSSATGALVVAGVSAGSPATRVALRTFPRESAPEVLAAAERGVVAIGGRGFERLLERARRVWQVRAAVEGGGDSLAPLVVAGVLAFVLLAPVVPPDAATIFGLKGVRERLEARGWRGGTLPPGR